ncbi:MAG: blaR, partial [Planctomycetaceae bacterium]|nr:blaR [Planctomycetaceae bacterium]
EPWDSEHNQKLLAKMPAEFRSPRDQADSRNTSYFALVTPGFKPQQLPGGGASLAGPAAAGAPGSATSPGTVADSGPPTHGVQYQWGTVFSNPNGTSLLDISDGVSNTVALVEAKRVVLWTKPEDIPYAADQPVPKLGGWFAEGWHAGFADGRAEFIANDNPDTTLRALFTIGGGENVTPRLVGNHSPKMQEQAKPAGH